jgi:uncharacterized protein YndB with AHSA1/START domain
MKVMSEQMPEVNMKADLVVKRIIDAPIEKVWKAWTEPEQVMKWWGPQYYTSPSCKMDFREGGEFLFCMRAPAEQGGQDFYTAGKYLKILPMERLEFTQGFADENGNKLDPAQVGMPPDFPAEIKTVVTFSRVHQDLTEITVKEFDWIAGQMYVYSLAGWHQSIDKLAEALVNL